MNVKMNSGLLAIFLATSVALSAAAFNQSNDGVQPPASDIRSLTEALSGRWSLNVKWEPDAENPNGLVNTGEGTWRSGPGGYTLIEEEQIRFPKKTANAYLLGIIWWDQTTKSLHGMECQNMLPFTCDLKGALNDITMTWDGNQFVIDEIENKTLLWHEVWSDIKPNSFTQTGEYGPRGGSLKRLFTMQAKRIGAK
jgi:hypothetical protein